MGKYLGFQVVKQFLLSAFLLMVGSNLTNAQQSAGAASASSATKNIIQINGVLMTADSLRAVPYAIVQLRNKNRGVMASESGVFSIVATKGDTLLFHSIGFRDKEYRIPLDLEGSQASMVQLMVQDTFYLPETIVRPIPTKEQFTYAFRNWNLPDDQLEIARKNTEMATLRALGYSLPKDGGENQSYYQNLQAVQSRYYGQTQPNNILNPLAWAEFFDSWKRGDYKRK